MFLLLSLALGAAPVLSPGPGPGPSHAAPAPPTRKLRVVVDPGHGAPGNWGNRGLDCQVEAEVMLAAGRRLAHALAETGRFEVLLSREEDQPSYDARLAAAVKWRADVIVSLHSDARGDALFLRETPDGAVCLRNDAEPGTAVLRSEEGGPALVEARARLCRALARALRQGGFAAYSGVNYGGLYRADEEDPGCWVDVHVPGKRIHFLRRASVPTVIIETHHALDRAEVDRWGKPATQDAFAAAVARALEAWQTGAPDAGR